MVILACCYISDEGLFHWAGKERNSPNFVTRLPSRRAFDPFNERRYGIDRHDYHRSTDDSRVSNGTIM